MILSLFTIVCLIQFPGGCNSQLIYTQLNLSSLPSIESDLVFINQTADSMYQSLRNDDNDGVTKITLHKGINDVKETLTYDLEDGLIFWCDVYNNAIMKMDVTNNIVTKIYDGISDRIGGIAVDWVANNVYWADWSYNWIMMSDYDGKYHHVVDKTGHSEPIGIAVDPINGKIYWADWKPIPRIESATLMGENRTILVSGDDILGLPYGLTLDLSIRRLYWTDVYEEALYSIDLDGIPGQMEIKLEYDEGGLYFPFFITLNKDYFFISEHEYEYIMILPRDNATYVNAAFLSTSPKIPMGVDYMDVTKQPPHNNICAVDNGGCDQLCISTATNHCLCTAGYVMTDNGTCVEDTHLIEGHRVLIADSVEICSAPVNLASIQDLSGTLNCFLNATVTGSFDYDFQQEMLYAYVPSDQAIKTVRLREGETFKVLHGDIQGVGGIALDWISSALYWTETTTNRVMVSTTQGLHKSIIANVNSPLAIAVHPLKGYLFWGAGGANPCIERSTLSGRHRIKLVIDDIIDPVAMVIDYHHDRLYWVDNGQNLIESIGVDGIFRTFVYASYGGRFGGIAVFQDFLIWTETDYRKLVFYNHDKDAIEKRFSMPDPPGPVRVYDEEIQPKFNGSNPCSYAVCFGLCVPYNGVGDCVCGIDDGNCTRDVYCPRQIEHASVHGDCDPRQGANCSYTCDVGFQPTSNKRLICTETGDWDISDDTLCVFGVSTEYFMLIGSPQAIHYVDLTSSTPTAVTLPIEDLVYVLGFDYSYGDNMIYLTDLFLETVSRVSLDGQNAEVMVDSNLLYPDGIEVDSRNGKVYWVDSDTDLLEVINLDGTGRRPLVVYDLDEPRALVLDEHNQVLYWTDWGFDAKVEKVKVDGTEREVVASQGMSHPLGLALDSKEGRLYWCDSTLDVLESCYTNGTDRKILYRLEPEQACYGLALTDDYIYYTDYVGVKVHRLNRTTFTSENFLPDLQTEDTLDIKIYRKPSATTSSPSTSTPSISTTPPIMAKTTTSPPSTSTPLIMETTTVTKTTLAREETTTEMGQETTMTMGLTTSENTKSTGVAKPSKPGSPVGDEDAKALIGIGVGSLVLSALIVILASVYFCRRRTRQDKYDIRGIEPPVFYNVDGDRVRGVSNPVYDNMESFNFESSGEQPITHAADTNVEKAAIS